MVAVRLPESLVTEMEAEARSRRVSKSVILRERLQRRHVGQGVLNAMDLVGDLIGSVDNLPENMSENTKRYLHKTGYGKKRSRRHRISRRAAKSS